jgi:hypothetical protein
MKPYGYIVADVLGLEVAETRKPSSNTMAWFRKLSPSAKKKFAKLSKPYRVRTTDNFKALVPIVMRTVPDVPDVISVGKNTFVKFSNTPLTYHCATVAKAKRLK